MPVTEVKGKKFIQLNFTEGSGEGNVWEMSKSALVRSIRLTGPPLNFQGKDYIIFGEAEGNFPEIFALSYDGRATFFHGSQPTKLRITRYLLTYPTEVIVSIEID